MVLAVALQHGGERMRIQIGIIAALFLGACTTAPPTVPEQVAAAPTVAAGSEQVTGSRAIVQGYVDKNQFSGTVLVAKDGKPVFREAFGLANRELDVAMTPESVLRLGSITKQFTAAAIMQLVEQGKLSVSDPVSKYYAAAPAAWSKITVEHLLNHRSGIPSYTGLPGFFEKQAMFPRKPEEIVALTQDMPLEFAPGTKHAYNNTGFVLLGYIIEKVSGQTYADYLQQHIFTPLGMKHSGYDDTTTLLPNRAAGYGFDNGVWSNSAYLSMTLPHAAGSLYSTVDDLLIWEEAFFSDKVVSAASRAAMTKDYGDRYGYGLGVNDLGGHKTVRHSGGIPGFSTDIIRFPDDGLTVIVLANLETAPSSRISSELGRFWLGIPAPPPPPPIVAADVKPEVLDRYVGVYELAPGFNITLTRDGATLSAQATGQGAFALTATSDTEFHFQPAGIGIVFPAGDGPAPSFTLHQGGPREAKRIAVN
jgi:CubicO group peptidase (beta-lactamase class C family)